MTTGEKELLLKDLSARLPYGVKCNVFDDFKHSRMLCAINPNISHCIGVENNDGSKINPIKVMIENIKPYLFPLSSMTEEQKNELNGLTDSIEIDSYGIMSKEEYDIYNLKPYFECVDLDDTLVVTDWLNAHHFDFRRLLEKGLAIDATELNVY